MCGVFCAHDDDNADLLKAINLPVYFYILVAQMAVLMKI